MMYAIRMAYIMHALTCVYIYHAIITLIVYAKDESIDTL